MFNIDLMLIEVEGAGHAPNIPNPATSSEHGILGWKTEHSVPDSYMLVPTFSCMFTTLPPIGQNPDANLASSSPTSL